MRPFPGRHAWRCVSPSKLKLLLAFCGVFALPAASVSAQDLFELEVFTYETAPRGDYDVALHTNVMSRGGVTPDSIAGAHHLMFGGLDIAMGGGWELSLSAGHCVTRHEPWLMRSVIGFGF